MVRALQVRAHYRRTLMSFKPPFKLHRYSLLILIGSLYAMNEYATFLRKIYKIVLQFKIFLT